ncbi:hypothetical protein VP01_346g5 [Puccinia sorghi]|uniref:Uncharacterized protein n=1 Tax=Puccinia sorghi TaxID=27349 RepID=A0A0L6UVZ3_9BASI|nr:hypothetical protein VP01_346g5 [Puccinia sorghi]
MALEICCCTFIPASRWTICCKYHAAYTWLNKMVCIWGLVSILIKNQNDVCIGEPKLISIVFQCMKLLQWEFYLTGLGLIADKEGEELMFIFCLKVGSEFRSILVGKKSNNKKQLIRDMSVDQDLVQGSRNTRLKGKEWIGLGMRKCVKSGLRSSIRAMSFILNTLGNFFLNSDGKNLGGGVINCLHALQTPCWPYGKRMWNQRGKKPFCPSLIYSIELLLEKVCRFLYLSIYLSIEPTKKSGAKGEKLGVKLQNHQKAEHSQSLSGLQCAKSSNKGVALDTHWRRTLSYLLSWFFFPHWFFFLSQVRIEKMMWDLGHGKDGVWHLCWETAYRHNWPKEHLPLNHNHMEGDLNFICILNC